MVALFRSRGLRSTRQRKEVFRCIAHATDHPDVLLVWQRVRQKIPHISLDSVYRILQTFEEQGWITRVGLPGERVRYDGNPSPHPHFVCVQCGAVKDLHSKDLSLPAPSDTLPGIGKVKTVWLQILGICESCLSDKSSEVC